MMRGTVWENGTLSAVIANSMFMKIDKGGHTICPPHDVYCIYFSSQLVALITAASAFLRSVSPEAKRELHCFTRFLPLGGWL